MTPPSRKPRGERFLSRPGDTVIVAPGEEPQDPRSRDRAGPLDLALIRHKRKITQMELAGAMGVDQAAVSRLEGREDFRMSTMLDYLTGLGADDVELTVMFKDGTAMAFSITPRRERKAS